MQIISDFTKDTQTDKPVPGSYEWWYFDAKSVDGYSLVVIFYEGNPFSRRYIQAIETGVNNLAVIFPAISISIYKNGKPIFYSFEEVLPEQALFSNNAVSGTVRKNYFEGNEQESGLIYSLKLNQSLSNGDKLKGELQFSGKHPEGKLQLNGAERSNGDHTWNLIMPKCNVEGELLIEGHRTFEIDFKGVGYHDHNTGFEPMKESFDEWYWGRYHFDDLTLVYYLMKFGGKWHRHGWLIENDRANIITLDSLSEQDFSYSRFGLYSARKVEFTGQKLDGLIQKEMVTDSGPFYQRFEGTAFIKSKKGILKGEGISEYIRPDRIYAKLFWPLVNMRIKYPGKPHWVQKSSRFYRWTW
ncbi:hypothetical protein [Rhodohalobacter halophilus]|uniref:hypothetical protein n=1 Tax=Rhodohalobacter halophilus TaxID=1812810 RepID=UPI00083F6B40|nr:hypothetical protein [Rhodohalobacter halophilus]